MLGLHCQLRQSADGLGQRCQIAAWLATQPGEYFQCAHLAYHLLRREHTDRCQANAAVAQQIRPNTTGRQHDERPGVRVNAVTHQHFSQACSHRLDQRQFSRQAGCVLGEVAAQGPQSRVQTGHAVDIQQHTADLCLVRNISRANLDGDWKFKRQRLHHVALQRQRHIRRMGYAELVQQVVGLGFIQMDRRCRQRRSIPSGLLQMERRAPIEQCGDHIRAGLGRPKTRHTRSGQLRNGLGRLRHQHRDQRFGTAGAVDDRLDGQLRLQPSRRTNHGHNQVKLGRLQQNVQRALHHVITCPCQSQVDDSARVHLNADDSELGQGRGRGRLRVKPPNTQLIDHHRRTAPSGGDNPDPRTRRLRCTQRQAQGQRTAFQQGVEDADSGDAAVAQESLGHIVLASQCARVGHDHFSGRR